MHKRHGTSAISDSLEIYNLDNIPSDPTPIVTPNEKEKQLTYKFEIQISYSSTPNLL